MPKRGFFSLLFTHGAQRNLALNEWRAVVHVVITGTSIYISESGKTRRRQMDDKGSS